MARAIDVAMYLLRLRDSDMRTTGDAHSLCNLKMQRLLYYCQGGHYRWDNARLIDDNVFESWDYGPVIRQVYYVFSYRGQNNLPALKDLTCHKKYKQPNRYEKVLTIDERETIEAVWQHLKKLSAFELVFQSQSEPPWRNARESGLLFISEDEIKNHFRDDINLTEMSSDNVGVVGSG